MKNKGRIFYILFCIVFIILLVLSDIIIARFLNNNFTKISNDIEKYQKDKVYYSFSEINGQDDVFQSFDFTGWAFCETESDNSNKEIKIILSNVKRTYMCDVNLMSRPDVVQAYKDINIRGVFHGFSETLSTVGVKNGIYKIYIYCKENEENYGLVYTGEMLKKDSNGISPYSWISSKSNITETEIWENSKYVIDSISFTKEGNMQITGWAFVEGKNTLSQHVYVRLTYANGESETYNTESVQRFDVGNAYKSDLYNNSGFKAIIPSEVIVDGDIKIEILIETDGNVYLDPYVSFYKTGNTEFDSNVSNNKKECTEIDLLTTLEDIEMSDNLKFHFDSCSVDKNLVINAWAFITDVDSALTDIYLAITTADGSTRVYTTSKMSRPDVAEAYENNLYAESGFTAVIPMKNISKGENTITVIADYGQILRATKPYTFFYETEEK